MTDRVVFIEANLVKLEQVDLLPLAPDEIRVRTHASLLSPGTELAHLTGRAWTAPDGRVMPQYPQVAGYSNAGEVVEVGDAAGSWNVGDRIASSLPHVGIAALRVAQPMWGIPEGVSFEEGTFTTLSATVLNGVRLGQPQLGEVAVVLGLGILGQMTSQFLRHCGVEKVVGVDLDNHRIRAAHETGGITHSVNPQQTDPRASVLELSEGRGADVVYEVTGLTETFDLAFDLARFKGRVVALGSPRWPATVDMIKLHLKALHLVGAIVSSHPNPGNDDNRWTREANGALFLRLVRSGVMKVAPLITHHFPYTEASKAYDLLVQKSEPALGVVLQW